MRRSESFQAMAHRLLLAIGVLFVIASMPAQAKDSGHYACTGVVKAVDGTPLGLSILVEDYRAAAGTGRDYEFSSVFGRKLFSGRATDVKGEETIRGSIRLQNKAHTLFSGSFSMTYASAPELSLSGEYQDDPSNDDRLKIKANIPCIDFSS
jgi:hypothetical protein